MLQFELFDIFEWLLVLHLLDALKLPCDFVLFLDALRFLGALILPWRKNSSSDLFPKGCALSAHFNFLARPNDSLLWTTSSVILVYAHPVLSYAPDRDRDHDRDPVHDPDPDPDADRIPDHDRDPDHDPDADHDRDPDHDRDADHDRDRDRDRDPDRSYPTLNIA